MNYFLFSKLVKFEFSSGQKITFHMQFLKHAQSRPSAQQRVYTTTFYSTFVRQVQLCKNEEFSFSSDILNKVQKENKSNC